MRGEGSEGKGRIGEMRRGKEWIGLEKREESSMSKRKQSRSYTIEPDWVSTGINGREVQRSSVISDSAHDCYCHLFKKGTVSDIFKENIILSNSSSENNCGLELKSNSIINRTSSTNAIVIRLIIL